jgi:hypothetical protein
MRWWMMMMMMMMMMMTTMNLIIGLYHSDNYKKKQVHW